MKLLHRFDVKLMTTANTEKHMMITTSFYRPHLDSAYKDMVSALLDDGLFDDFIASIIRLLACQGKWKHFFEKKEVFTSPFLFLILH